jgi:hypothetical protein
VKWWEWRASCSFLLLWSITNWKVLLFLYVRSCCLLKWIPLPSLIIFSSPLRIGTLSEQLLKLMQTPSISRMLPTTPLGQLLSLGKMPGIIRQVPRT